MKRGNQGRGACLGEFEGSANVVTATSAAHRTPVHDDAGWFCELMGRLPAFVSNTTMALVEDGVSVGSTQLDMGNSGYIL